MRPRDAYPFTIQDVELFRQIERMVGSMPEGTIASVGRLEFVSAYCKIEKPADLLFGSEVSPFDWFAELHPTFRAVCPNDEPGSVLIERGRRRTERRMVIVQDLIALPRVWDRAHLSTAKQRTELRDVPVEPPEWVFKIN
jgi:hypothetical protein